MRTLIALAALAAMISGYSATVLADGCYMCGDNTFVKYSGEDNADKRKAAKACGCTIGGTRGDCSASNLKILCSVQNDTDESIKLAACESEEENSQN